MESRRSSNQVGRFLIGSDIALHFTENQAISLALNFTSEEVVSFILGLSGSLVNKS